jgi:hypothetical protein
MGYQSLLFNTTGTENTAMGYQALNENTTADDNTAVGWYSLHANSIGERNTAVGMAALALNGSGNDNTAIGRHAGSYNETGSENTFVGSWTGAFISHSNTTAVGYNTHNSADNQVRIGNSSVTSIGGYEDWSNISDARFKFNVLQNVPGLDFVLRLNPVTYNLDVEKLNQFLGIPDSVSQRSEFSGRSIVEKSNAMRTGFIAQDVEKAAAEIGYDFSGVDKPKNEHDHYGLRYAQFVVPLVKAVQELSEQNRQLQEVIRELSGNENELTIRNEEMKRQIEQLFARIEAIEKK